MSVFSITLTIVSIFLFELSFNKVTIYVYTSQAVY